MPDLATVLLFAVASLALTLTPGPDMLLIASRTVAQGRTAGFITLAGIQLGTYIHAAAAALGLSQLFAAVPAAYDVVKWAGALYLLYLAWTTVRSAGASIAADPSSQAASNRQMFTQGLITNLLNPKMILFVLALFPQFVSAQAGNVGLQIMLLATVLNAIGLLVNGAVILAAGQTRRYVSRINRSRLPDYILSAVFAALALRLAGSSRD